MYQDYYLHQPGSIKNVTGGFYKKFTPFYTKIIGDSVIKPRYIRKYVFKKSSIEQTPLQKIKSMFVKKNPELIVKGGRENGLKKLYETAKHQKHYSDTRNQLSINTSLLSAYIKFGCVSIREVYHFFHKHFGKNSELLRQLIWREFYAHVLYGFPELLDKNVNNPIKWPNNESYFEAWIKGNTGFPVVDACMRQLNSIGWMHNRGRLIASCFLIKTLLVDWRYGEQYFAKKLVDYDVANNNGNWQWISGTGADSMPYFRTFSPWIQSKTYDADAEYIKKWVPELNNVSSTDIHDWNNSYKKSEYSMIKYPKPIVDFGEQRIKSLVLYKKYL
jgi:deoxyribodipyrimidine photo-lyase